jgi:hypothetical protein
MLTRAGWLALVGMAVIAAWWRASDPMYILDDSFISLRYAANFVAGEGLVYNPSEYVEGYTNLLWVLVGALGIAAGFDAFSFVRAAGMLSWVALFPMLAICVAGVSGRIRLWHVAFASAWLVIPPNVGGFAATGMETTFASWLVLLFAWLQHGGDPASVTRRVAGSVVGLALLLTRPDLGVFVAASLLVHAWRLFHRHHGGAAIRAESAQRFGVTAVGLICWLLWKSYYYGDIVPNSYYAKQQDGVNLHPGFLYLFSWIASYPQTIVFILLCIAAIAARTQRGKFAQFTLLSLLFQCLYMLHSGGDFMEYRMMHHIYPLLVAAAATALASPSWLPRWGAVSFALVATILSFAPTTYETEYNMHTLEGMTRCCGARGIPLGKRLREVLPPQTIIATTMAGGMPFYSGLRTIDQLGLNDRKVATLPPVEKVVRGHMRRAPREYLESRGVHLIFAHPTVCSCSKLCYQRGDVNVFIRLDKNNCLRSWYLTRDEALTRLFCARPQDFVLRGVTCPPA